MSRIVLTAASRVGCVRSNNEDMVLAYDQLVRSDASQTEFMTENVDRFVIAVADGMGGHRAGEVASELVLSNLRFYLNDLPQGLSAGRFNEVMQEWLTSINHTVNSRGHGDVNLQGMGTTLVALVYYGGKYFWMNCGDSRLYRYRDGQLSQLTVDHSLNTMTGQTKHSNVITNCIGGGFDHSYVDILEITDDFKEGDAFMLCSDGLNDMISDAEIAELMGAGVSANRLCEAAIEAGGFDNVSACVIKVY